MADLRGKTDYEVKEAYKNSNLLELDEIGKELKRRGYNKKGNGVWEIEDEDEDDSYEESNSDSNSRKSGLFSRFIGLLLIGAIIIYLLNPTILKDVFGIGSEAAYGNFNDAVSNLAYQDAGSGLQWTASTGEKGIMFASEEDNVIFITKLGVSSEETSVGLKALIENYDEKYFEGKVIQTSDSKKNWLNKSITIEQVDNNNIVINIGNEKITLTK